ncbi:hypothetical protein [Streptomyces sp. SR-10]|uniref:hypothetical protein n=1 Tax=Streptomyces sp. SR-10 TaxID=3416442 RepID=UPI003CEAD1ED
MAEVVRQAIDEVHQCVHVPDELAAALDATSIGSALAAPQATYPSADWDECSVASLSDSDRYRE